MNQDNLNKITIALAGLFQALTLVRELTQTGRLHETAFQASIYSIFQIAPKDVAAVYGDLSHLKLGLQKIIDTFDATHQIDRLQHRYLLSIIHLQKKLARAPKLMEQMTTRLSQTQKQADYFSLTHPTVIANLADIYLNTVSTFRFRIMILGNQRVMHVKENLDKVRALLLAGVRATVLWRQMGGSRLQLLFSRAKIRAAAERLLNQIEHESITKDIA
ncbi:MAG: high frequency lysogenization protein HflD [Pseudomonadota bacterium]